MDKGSGRFEFTLMDESSSNPEVCGLWSSAAGTIPNDDWCSKRTQAGGLLVLTQIPTTMTVRK